MSDFANSRSASSISAPVIQPGCRARRGRLKLASSRPRVFFSGAISKNELRVPATFGPVLRSAIGPQPLDRRDFRPPSRCTGRQRAGQHRYAPNPVADRGGSAGRREIGADGGERREAGAAQLIVDAQAGQVDFQEARPNPRLPHHRLAQLKAGLAEPRHDLGEDRDRSATPAGADPSDRGCRAAESAPPTGPAAPTTSPSTTPRALELRNPKRPSEPAKEEQSIDDAGDKAEIARQVLTLLLDQLRGFGSGARLDIAQEKADLGLDAAE